MKEDLNWIVGEKCKKWGEIEGKEGELDFEDGEGFVELGIDNGMRVIGDWLIWDCEVGEWLWVDEKGENVCGEKLKEGMKRDMERVVGG